MTKQTTVEAKPVKKKTTGKWTRVQAFGFWFVVTATVAFWSGAFVGNQAATNYHNDIKAASKASQ